MDGVGSGFVAMVLGAIGWLNDRPPTVSGINENTSSQARPSAVACWISRAALAVWSPLAADPTPGLPDLAVVGFTMFLSPWLAGFARDQAAWAAWIPGVTATALGVAGYLRGESLDFARTVRADADARYRDWRHRAESLD